jgi:hypothetical protein
MEFKKLGANKDCQVFQIGKWRYLKYHDGRGWWQFRRKP